ncbi:MAG: hypothetical protein ACMG6S_23430 [Byssovorax sp.]
MRSRLFAILTLSLACLGTSACSSTPDPVAPVDPNACPPGQLCPPPAPTTPPVATTPAPAPSATATTSAATALPPRAGAAVTPVLSGMASTDAPGMKPDGSPFAGQFKEGDTLEQAINIQPGKCYTVVGASIGGIVELDIQLVAQTAPLPPMVLAQDSTTGPTATLGAKGQCFRNPLPVGGPGKVILKATKGAGLAAAQVYIK